MLFEINGNLTVPFLYSPVSVVERQFDAYNAKDICAWLSTYASNAQQFLLYGECLAIGHDQIRDRIIPRFMEPDLHAKLLNRTVFGNFVMDQELVTRNFPEGIGTIEMLCIYEVLNGLIRRASFAFGEKKLLSGIEISEASKNIPASPVK